MASILKYSGTNIPTSNFSLMPVTIDKLIPPTLSGKVGNVQGLGSSLNAMGNASQIIFNTANQITSSANVSINVPKTSDASMQDQPQSAEEAPKDGKGGSALNNALGGAVIGGLLGGTGGALAGAIAGGTGALGKMTGAVAGNGKQSVLQNVLGTVAQTAVTATVAKTVLGGAGGNLMAKATVAMGAISVVDTVAKACQKKKKPETPPTEDKKQ